MMTFVPQLRRALVFAAMLLNPAWLAQAANLAQTHQIKDLGQSHAFVIATDELQVVGRREPEKILPAASAEGVRQQAEALSRALGREVRLVLYAQGSARTEFSRRILTREVLVHLKTGTDAQALARTSGAKVSRKLDYLRDHFLFSTSEAAGALTLAEVLRGQPGVISAEPQLARLAQKKMLPNDPLFAQQWHLRNIGAPGIDINVTNVWDNFRGTGIYIGIVDDGFQYAHPDLAPNADTNIDYDFNSHDLDPAPDAVNHDFHGTAVAGVAAARGNNGVGACGTAYEAKLVGLRLIAHLETDADDADAMLHSNSVIQIKNNSWGPPDCDSSLGTVLRGPGPLMSAALAQGVAAGRNGKGVIYTWAGGNGRSCGEDVNYDGYANSINVFAVGAVGNQGNQTYYSEPGACLVVTAPGGDSAQWVTTTDLAGNEGYNYSGAPSEVADPNYTKRFGGTSASAPLVAGVIALVLQANPDLGHRDVKEILLRSSTKVQPADGDWRTNAAGIPHNHKFGAGLVNAQAAVALATNWGNLGPVTNVSLLQTNLAIHIPDNDSNGVTQLFTFTNANFRVEHITLTMTAPHASWGDLAVTVTSPSGMQSRLAELHGSADRGTNYQGWTFTSVRHWGETAEGVWKVKVADLAPGWTGSLQGLELNLLGTTPAATLTVGKTNQSLRLNLQAAAPGWSYAIETSSNMTSWAQLATLTIPPAGQTNYVDADVSLQNRCFYRARLLP